MPVVVRTHGNAFRIIVAQAVVGILASLVFPSTTFGKPFTVLSPLCATHERVGFAVVAFAVLVDATLLCFGKAGCEESGEGNGRAG